MSRAGGNERPVPATRRTAPSTAPSTNSSTPSSGLLINVIRTLTTSVSEDQRELEKTKLERGYKESGETIDRLIKDHQKDIEDCLSSFKDMSSRISACRERIQNVRNALHSCKVLLECRRDDLKKLWIESAQQRHISDIMNKLDELRSVPVEVELLLQRGSFDAAAAAIQKSKRDLRDLEVIDGLSQLRVRIEESKDSLTTHIVERIVCALVDEPFEKKMGEMLVGVSEERITESGLLAELATRIKQHRTEPLHSRIDADVRALEMLDKEVRVIDRIGNFCASAIERQIRATVSLIRIRSSTDENNPPDNVLLAQLMKMVYRQIDASRDAHVILSERVRQPDVLPKFWRSCQTAVDQLVSDHVGLQVATSVKPVGGVSENLKRLFRFDATACAPFSSAANPTNSRVICRPDMYNIVPLYPWLRHLITSIEESSGIRPCTLSQFVDSLLMEKFMKRVEEDVREKLEDLRVKEGVASVARRQENLPASQVVYEMCSEVHHLLVNMEQYAQRFSRLWLLILTVYTCNMQHFYEKATLSSPKGSSDVGGADGGTGPARKKISAAWAADEDISRLLMSLPNWQLASLDASSPTGGVQSEREIRERNERESDILIGNLGMQRGIDRAELISHPDEIRQLASLHENLRSLSLLLRGLLTSLPPSIVSKLREHKVTVTDEKNNQLSSTPVLVAVSDYISQINAMSERLLLMLHLEVRVHCFYHLLPLARPRSSHQTDDVDPEVHEMGRDLFMFGGVVRELLPPPKQRYIFDGLGHLCAAIFIHSSQHMQRLSDAAKKRVCRNIWGVQQRLSQLTERREAELDRARAFYELLSHDVDRLMALVPEKRGQFSNVELTFLISLAVRSHAVLASQPGALDSLLLQLSSILRQAPPSASA